MEKYHMTLKVKIDGQIEDYTDIVENIRLSPDKILNVITGNKTIYKFDNITSLSQISLMGDGTGTASIYYFTKEEKDENGNRYFEMKKLDNLQDGSDTFIDNDTIIISLLKIAGFIIQPDNDLKVHLL